MSTTTVALCQKWHRDSDTMVLSGEVFPEVSGIAASRSYLSRLYYVNDGPRDPYFYVSDRQAGDIRAVRVDGLEGWISDVEAISVGPCDNDACLFIGDIGDNFQNRNSVRVFVIEEPRKIGESVTPMAIIAFRYPDGPHDAEAMAVDSQGDIYVATKERNLRAKTAFASRIFRLRRELWERTSGNEIHTMEFVGELDLPSLAVPFSAGVNPVATALDIAADSDEFLVLTYELAFEFSLDIPTATRMSADELKSGDHYRPVRVEVLPQQEAITYLPQANGFLYATEARHGQAEMIHYRCMD